MNESKQADAFLADVKNDSVVLDDKGVMELFDKPVVPEAKESKSEEDEEDKPKTRRYKRLEKKNEEMGQMITEMNERIKELSQVDKYIKDNEGDIDPDLVKAFGTTEDGKTLTGIFSKKFKEIEANAERRARESLLADQAKASEQEKIESVTIDNAIDSLEDRFNVDLSGKSKASKDLRNGFLDFVEQLSPKDSDGNIKEYADFGTAFETYSKLAQNTKPREVSERQKELASRGMTHSGPAVSEAPKGPITFKTVGRMIDALRNQ